MNRITLIAVITCLLLPRPIYSQADEYPLVEPYSKYFSLGEIAVKAGFVPDKAEYVWPERIFYFTFVVMNVGQSPLIFTDGGDYRGGRSESHKITAVDANGQPVPVPSMPRMGGRVSVVKLLPGEVYTKMLPVSRRLTFTGPGVYTVTGERTLKLGGLDNHDKGLGLPIRTSFQLIIHPYSKRRMAKVIDDLVARIRAAGDLAPQPLEYTEPLGTNVANRLYLAMAALAAIEDEAVVHHFSAMAKDGSPQLRVAALERLGGFTDVQAFATVIEALDDPAEPIRSAAATALGHMKTDAAVDTLIAALSEQPPAVAPAILRAMGATRSPRVFDILVQALTHEDSDHRRAAVDALVSFGDDKAIEALKTCVGDDDMDFREFVVRKLAESLRRPIDAQWLVPVIQSRRNTCSLGDAPRLLRLYAGPKAVPALLSCLDYDEPSIRSSYNWWIMHHQSSCDGGLKIPWISDLNRDGTPTEIEQNRRSLKIVKAWVDHYYKYRLDEEPAPKYPDCWGVPVDEISIRLRTNQRVWPEGMPQLLHVDVRSDPGQGSINLSRVPELLEVQLNDHWYARQPALKDPTMGIDAGHGSSFHNIQLDDKWRRKSDGQPLQLTPGQYTLRAGISITPQNQRTPSAISRPLEIEIIPAPQE